MEDSLQESATTDGRTDEESEFKKCVDSILEKWPTGVGHDETPATILSPIRDYDDELDDSATEGQPKRKSAEKFHDFIQSVMSVTPSNKAEEQETGQVNKLKKRERDFILLIMLKNKKYVSQSMEVDPPGMTEKRIVVWNDILSKFERRFGRRIEKDDFQLYNHQRRTQLKENKLLISQYQEIMYFGLSVEEKLERLGNKLTATELLVFEDLLLEDNIVTQSMLERTYFSDEYDEDQPFADMPSEFMENESFDQTAVDDGLVAGTSSTSAFDKETVRKKKHISRQSSFMELSMLKHMDYLLKLRGRSRPADASWKQDKIWNDIVSEFERLFGKKIGKHAVQRHYSEKRYKIMKRKQLLSRYLKVRDLDMSLHDKWRKIADVCTETTLLLLEKALIDRSRKGSNLRELKKQNCSETPQTIERENEIKKRASELLHSLRLRHTGRVSSELAQMVDDDVETARISTDMNAQEWLKQECCTPDPMIAINEAMFGLPGRSSPNANDNSIQERSAIAPMFATHAPMYFLKPQRSSAKTQIHESTFERPYVEARHSKKQRTKTGVFRTHLSTEESDYLVLSILANNRYILNYQEHKVNSFYRTRTLIWNEILNRFERKFGRKTYQDEALSIFKRRKFVLMNNVHINNWYKGTNISDLTLEEKHERLQKICSFVDVVLMEHIQQTAGSRFNEEESNFLVTSMLRNINYFLPTKELLHPNFERNMKDIWKSILCQFEHRFDRRVTKDEVEAFYEQKKRVLRENYRLFHPYMVITDSSDFNEEGKLEGLGHICTDVECLLMKYIMNQDQSLRDFDDQPLSLRVEDDTEPPAKKKMNGSNMELPGVGLAETQASNSNHALWNENSTIRELRLAHLTMMKDQRSMMDAQRTMMEAQLQFNSNISTCLQMMTRNV